MNVLKQRVLKENNYMYCTLHCGWHKVTSTAFEVSSEKEPFQCRTRYSLASGKGHDYEIKWIEPDLYTPLWFIPELVTIPFSARSRTDGENVLDHEKTDKMSCDPNKVSSQPGHLQSD